MKNEFFLKNNPVTQSPKCRCPYDITILQDYNGISIPRKLTNLLKTNFNRSNNDMPFKKETSMVFLALFQ